jgi:hypothetical protein
MLKLTTFLFFFVCEKNGVLVFACIYMWDLKCESSLKKRYLQGRMGLIIYIFAFLIHF